MLLTLLRINSLTNRTTSMELIFLISLATLLFWGTIRNLRRSSEVLSVGLVAAASVYTVATAKQLTAEDLITLQKLKEL